MRSKTQTFLARVRFICFFATLVLSTSCAQTVKRQAHILPVYDGRFLFSAKPIFIDSSEEARYLSSEVKRPPKSTVARLGDGTFKITWITTLKRPEKLMFLDSGLHPEVVPDKAIRETFDLEEEIPIDEPFILTGFGPNTAFIREHIDLRPIPGSGSRRTGNSGTSLRALKHTRGGVSP